MPTDEMGNWFPNLRTPTQQEPPTASFPWVPLPAHVDPVRARWVRAAYEEVAWARHNWMAAHHRFRFSTHAQVQVEWDRLMAAERNYKRVRATARKHGAALLADLRDDDPPPGVGR
jgi:hypothetical protein